MSPEGGRDLSADPNVLVSDQRPYVYRVCLGLCSDPEAAEDLTQDTLIRACGALGGFGSRSSIQTWLYRIAVRTWSRSRFKSGAEEVQPLGGLQNCTVDPSARLIASIDIERAVNKLTPALRQIGVLCILCECTAAEAADTLCIDVVTAKRRLTRARIALRLALSSESPPPRIGGFG